jgi:23S rRNA C2498 (ribose-2'-O)-methylase RlmM
MFGCLPLCRRPGFGNECAAEIMERAAGQRLRRFHAA